MQWKAKKTKQSKSFLKSITWIQPAVTELDLASVWIQWGDDHWVDLTAHDLWHSACVAAGLWAARVSPGVSGDFCCVFSEGTAGPPAHNQRVIGSSIETDAWGTALTLREMRTFDETSHLHAVIRVNRWHCCLYTLACINYWQNFINAVLTTVQQCLNIWLLANIIFPSCVA